ncbi:hypothetical protein B4U80_09750 [Leptotrombidium deliense]|uniref:Uncharacterized protein n=1 Tax=Leptotrombidium deliense TaxID=299467 RepID=A0A443QJF8_9ACAR|nr:hypothetical protein B4U80_09750 [Leptotrombidium deliense]
MTKALKNAVKTKSSLHVDPNVLKRAIKSWIVKIFYAPMNASLVVYAKADSFERETNVFLKVNVERL